MKVRMIGFWLLATCLSVCAGDFVVIVNAANSVNQITMRDLSKLYLKKQTTWPDGRVVVPVAQSETLPIRAIFTERVHKRPLSVLQKYWLKQAFSGTSVKPVEKDSDAAVIAFVGKENGGIGYVSFEVVLPESVKVVMITD